MFSYTAFLNNSYEIFFIPKRKIQWPLRATVSF